MHFEVIIVLPAASVKLGFNETHRVQRASRTSTVNQSISEDISGSLGGQMTEFGESTMLFTIYHLLKPKQINEGLRLMKTLLTE